VCYKEKKGRKGGEGRLDPTASPPSATGKKEKEKRERKRERARRCPYLALKEKKKKKKKKKREAVRCSISDCRRGKKKGKKRGKRETARRADLAHFLGKEERKSSIPAFLSRKKEEGKIKEEKEKNGGKGGKRSVIVGRFSLFVGYF